MSIAKPEATAPVNPRRAFLARAAVGGALVTAGSIVGPLLPGRPAGAQDAGGSPAAPDTLDDPAYAQLVTPLELAAVQVYAAALAVPGLSDEDTEHLSLFQTHHAKVAETVGEYYAGDEPLAADPALVATAVGGDRTAALAALGSLEDSLAATHLWALGGITDSATAKLAASILAVEGQHAVALAVLGEADLAAVTPATVTTDGSLSGGVTPIEETPETDGSTTTEAGDSTTTTGEAGN